MDWFKGKCSPETMVIHGQFTMKYGVFHVFPVKIVPLKPWTSRDPARSYPRWDEVRGLLQDTPFFEEKNRGKSWNSRRCHGFNMFQCISMVSLDEFGSSYLDSEIE